MSCDIVNKSFFSCLYDEYLYTSGRTVGNPAKIAYLWLMGRNFRANVWIAKMQHTRSKIVKKLIRNHLEAKYTILLYESARIGSHFRVEHAMGIVIGQETIIGNQCKVYQQVTFGQKNGKYPVIGDKVTIYPGAKIIGSVHVGDRAVIGTNAVVLHDVPEGTIVAGCPARIIGRVKNDGE